MGNPARELAHLLRQWQSVEGSNSVFTSRGEGKYTGGDLDFWRHQSAAAALVGRVDAEIQARGRNQRRISHYEEALVSWYRCVFAPDQQWGSKGNASYNLVDAQSLNLLESLADVLDERARTFDLSTDQRMVMNEGLTEVLELLSSEEVRLSDSAKVYLAGLTAKIKGGIEPHSDLDEAELVRSINELTGAVTSVADALDEAGSQSGVAGKLRAAIRKISPYAGFAAAALGVVADTLAIVAVTMGPAT